MTHELIEIDTSVSSQNYNQTIWDIENAEKLQFVAFIEDKIEEKYLKKFEYFEQLFISLKEDYTNQISKLTEELNYTKTKLEETNQHLYYLQEEQAIQITNISDELHFTQNKLEQANKCVDILQQNNNNLQKCERVHQTY
jgi:hypothetical protein